MFVLFLFSWLARTNPKDVARVESRTFICTNEPNDVVPRVNGGKSSLGNWISPKDYTKAIIDRFPGCMKGTYLFIYCKDGVFCRNTNVKSSPNGQSTPYGFFMFEKSLLNADSKSILEHFSISRKTQLSCEHVVMLVS